MAAGAGQPTLANIVAYSGDAVQRLVEQFQRSSFLLQRMTFLPNVNPDPGAGILAYTYGRTATQRGAAFRDWYVDYAPAMATIEQVTAQLRPFGGAIELDRVFADADRINANRNGIASWLEFQISELARAVAQKWHDAVINGDSGVDALSFDGLSTILEGSTSEIDGAALDLTVAGTNNVNYWTALGALQKYINRVRGQGLQPVIFTNEDGAAVLSAIGAQLNYRSEGTGAFGETITSFAGAPIVDLGVKPGTAGTPVVPTTSGDATAANNGLSDIYIVGMGRGGFYAVTLTGDSGVRYYSNIFDPTPGVTRRYEGEMVAAPVVEHARSAYVLRDVRVVPLVA